MNARTFLLTIAIAGAWGWAAPAAAHCDTLDGPVVGAARRALDSGRVEHALIWVQKTDERAIRDAFVKARKARAAGGVAAKQADDVFYATLVRIHRNGEGAPYTGLKPAGHVEPPIAAADRSLASGQRAEVEKLLVETTQAGLRKRFDDAAQKKEFAPEDVDAGRAYVGAYVDYVHYVERVAEAAAPAANPHAAHEHAVPAAKAAPAAATTPATRHGH
jgi:hypothetical protein